MFSNKDAINLFYCGTSIESFKNYLKHKNFDEETINNFLVKASQIFNKLTTKRKNIGMLVGKVQSGKTTVFSATIAKYFDQGYDLCIILTALENVLHDQTKQRMEDVFNHTLPSKIDVFNCETFLLRNSFRRLEKIKSDFDNKHKYIVTILKNKQIEKIQEALALHKLWKNKKILIIDDEADLASTGSNNLEDSRYANNAIRNLLESLSNYNYLSVTATPQAQVLINDDDVVKPKHVFTYEPGRGYMGLEEFFSHDKYFQLIDSKEWKSEDIKIIPDSLKKAILKYFINISYYILTRHEIKTTTMLIHTSVAIESHYKMMRLIIKYVKNILSTLKLNAENFDYQNLVKEIRTILANDEISEITLNNDYIALLQKIIENTNVNIINSESDDTIVENLNNIVLGSKKLERGVTLDNLLVTYIANYTEGVTAVDTILQRARWFGYRNNIEQFISIYITEDLFNEYKEFILPSEIELWERLKKAEDEDNFKDFEKYITLNGSSAPTSKVKLKRSSGEKILFYNSSVERDSVIEKNSKRLYSFFKKNFEPAKINIVSRPYHAVLNVNFDKFNEILKTHNLYDVFSMDKYFYDEIIAKSNANKIMVIFFDEANNNKFRERKPENGKYQLFEGEVEESGFPGENRLFEVPSLNEFIIVGLHKIKDKKDGETRYYVSLHLPKNNQFNGKYYTA